MEFFHGLNEDDDNERETRQVQKLHLAVMQIVKN